MVAILLPRPTSLLLVSLLTAGLLAGCLDTDGTDGQEVLPYDATTVAFPAQMFFDDGFTMSERDPLGDTRSAPLGDFYTKWMEGSGFPEWSSGPLVDPIVVKGPVQLRFWVTAESVVTSTPGIFPDFVVYFGTTESVLSVVSPTELKPVAQDFSVITMEDAVLVEADFDLPPGGVVVPRGAGLRVVTAPVMMETEPADLHVLYGSEEFPSGVRYHRSVLKDGPDLMDPVEPRTTSHMLAAGTFLHGEEVDGTNIYTESFEVDDQTDHILVDLDFTGDTPFPDMDLYVLGPDGEEVALSVTPGADESVHLYGPNIDAVGPGTWSLKVVNYVTAGATFDLSVAVGQTP